MAENIDSTCSECDNTSAVVGGVVAVAIVLIVAVTAIFIVMLFLRNRRTQYIRFVYKRQNDTFIHQVIFAAFREAVDIPSYTNAAVELSNLSGEPTYV